MKFTTHRHNPEERMEIARAYLENDLTLAETANIYGISTRSLKNWVKNLRMSEKNVNFAVRKRKQRMAEQLLSIPKSHAKDIKLTVMQPKSVEELERELSRVKKELAEEKMRVIALNTLIDVAEENGYRIRKKSGAKQ